MPAIQDAINKGVRQQYLNGTNPFRCTTIDVRDFCANGMLTITEPIVIPSSRSIRLVGGAHSETAIVTNGNFPCVIVEQGHRVAQVDGCLLHGGGVVYQGLVNAHWGVTNSTITGADIAIQVVGRSCVNGIFYDVRFRRNKVNLQLDIEQCNLITFEECEFLETYGDVGAVIACSDVRFIRCNWERALGTAYIRLEARKPGLPPDRIARSISFDCCRWGPERFSSSQPVTPKYIMLIGNDAPSRDTIYGVSCVRADFTMGASVAVIRQSCYLKNAEFSQVDATQIPVFMEPTYPLPVGASNAYNRIIGEPISKKGFDGWCLVNCEGKNYD